MLWITVVTSEILNDQIHFRNEILSYKYINQVFHFKCMSLSRSTHSNIPIQNPAFFYYNTAQNTLEVNYSSLYKNMEMLSFCSNTQTKTSRKWNTLEIFFLSRLASYLLYCELFVCFTFRFLNIFWDTFISFIGSLK